MKVLTDDPDWARDSYAARALALTVVRRHSRPNPGSRSLHAIGDGFAISYYPNRSPLLLTIDMGASRVLSIEWKKGDAWRAEIEIYEARGNAASERWQIPGPGWSTAEHW
jgi:hypothetical protein